MANEDKTTTMSPPVEAALVEEQAHTSIRELERTGLFRDFAHQSILRTREGYLVGSVFTDEGVRMRVTSINPVDGSYMAEPVRDHGHMADALSYAMGRGSGKTESATRLLKEALEQRRLFVGADYSADALTAAEQRGYERGRKEEFDRGYDHGVDFMREQLEIGQQRRDITDETRGYCADLLGCEPSDITLGKARCMASRAHVLVLRAKIGSSHHQELKEVPDHDLEADVLAADEFEAQVYRDLAHRIKKAKDATPRAIPPLHAGVNVIPPGVYTGQVKIPNGATVQGSPRVTIIAPVKPCDDCGTPSSDLITKADHHGGDKTVCRDRDACHRREADREQAITDAFVFASPIVSSPHPTEPKTYTIKWEFVDGMPQGDPHGPRLSPADHSAELRRKLAASEAIHGPFVYCASEDD